MQIDTVKTAGTSLLDAVQATIAERKEAVLAVAFVSKAGVNLVGKELKTVGGARLLATSTFGSNEPRALAAAQKAGAHVRILNPSGGTYSGARRS